MPTGLSFFRGSPSGLNTLALGAAFGLAALSYGVNAASTSGTASATVLAQISSQPVPIVSASPAFVAASQSVALPLPIRLGFSIDRPSRLSAAAGATSNGAGEGSSFGMTMIDVDASGVARFSVAGAGTTSGYIVQFPASTDSLLDRSPSAAVPCVDGASTGQGCTDSALIVPAQALRGGGRLAVEISQALSKLIAGELSVQVNYN
ncbi:MAG: hypothetical protein Q8K71_14875 [Polaromonas sp.]|nr:hypothetical protein [Polaromonas sp.]MDP3751650.1 hypothetical protein [Polaromonas sp.]